jgi:hypothetical protein
MQQVSLHVKCKLGILPVPIYLLADSVSLHLVEVWYSIAVNIAEASIKNITRLFRDFKKSLKGQHTETSTNQRSKKL